MGFIPPFIKEVVRQLADQRIFRTGFPAIACLPIAALAKLGATAGGFKSLPINGPFPFPPEEDPPLAEEKGEFNLLVLELVNHIFAFYYYFPAVLLRHSIQF